MSPKSRVSTRTFLVGFSLLLVLPVFGLAAFGLLYYARTERARLEETAEQTARQIGAIIDGEIGTLLASINALSTSSALLRDDFEHFHAQAKRFIGGRDEVIVLRTIEGRQLVNTQVAFGQELPNGPPLDAAQRAVYEDGKPLVTNVYTSPISGEARVAVVRKPLASARPDYLLAITVPTDRFLKSFQAAIPPGWIIGIGDRSGTYLTHSVRHAEVTGKPGTASYLSRAVGESGTFYAKNGAGVDLLAGYYRSPLTGWLIAANISAQTVEAPLRRSLAVGGTAAAILLLLTAAFAHLFSQRLASSARALAIRAEALGQGRSLPPVRSEVREFAIIDEAMDHANKAIVERAQLTEKLSEAFKQKDELLKEVNHRVKNSLQLVASLLNLQRMEIHDEETRKHFQEAARRINTVAQVHQRLYAEDRVDRVAFHDFLSLLCNDLNASRPEGKARIACEVEPVYLPTETMIPAAIISNELVASALAHAVARNAAGAIQVRCDRQGQTLELSVSGVRVLPTGLGEKIVGALLKQLRGTIAKRSAAEGGGVVVSIPVEEKQAGVARGAC